MYRPEIGHTIEAFRRTKSRIFANHVKGPVISVYENACDLLMHLNGKITFHRVYFNDWDVEYHERTLPEEYLGFGTNDESKRSV